MSDTSLAFARIELYVLVSILYEFYQILFQTWKKFKIQRSNIFKIFKDQFDIKNFFWIILGIVCFLLTYRTIFIHPISIVLIYVLRWIIQRKRMLASSIICIVFLNDRDLFFVLLFLEGLFIYFPTIMIHLYQLIFKNKQG